MKIKRILRFYFRAESLECAFDNLITKIAASSFDKDSFISADRLCRIIGEKSELAELWNYLDGIIPKLSEEEQSSLEEYALLRCGIKRLKAEDVKRLRRAAVKFKRRARRLERFSKSAELVAKYYCLIRV